MSLGDFLMRPETARGTKLNGRTATHFAILLSLVAQLIFGGELFWVASICPKRPFLGLGHESTVAHHVGSEDGCESPLQRPFLGEAEWLNERHFIWLGGYRLRMLAEVG